MGALNLPASGAVYVDANCVIYGVEKVKPYAALLDPLWQAAVTGSISIISSQIVLVEVLFKPLREKNALLEDRFREFLLASEICRANSKIWDAVYTCRSGEQNGEEISGRRGRQRQTRADARGF